MGIRPTFYGLEIGRTGLMVSQKGLDVTGHNIANVDTAGYTRQRLVNTAYEPYNAVTQFRPVDMALVGSGARVMILDQIRDSFLDRQFRSEQTLLSYWETRTQGLSYVESLLEDSSSGSLAASLYSFISSLNTESTEATDREQRVNIQKAAANLTENFNLVYERLVDQQKSQNLAVETVTLQINTIAENLAVLNKSIYTYEMEGQPANDLRDKRNLLLDELSSLVDIEYRITDENKMIVTVGGVELVNHTSLNTIKCRQEPNVLPGGEDALVPYWDSGPYVGTNVEITGGELKAHIDLRDNISSENPGIPYFIEQLNTMVRALAKIINDQHKEGYTHPASGASVNGVNFFDVPLDASGAEDYSLIMAGNFKLSQAILDSVYNIASSSKQIVMDLNNPDYNRVDDPIAVDGNGDPILDANGDPIKAHGVGEPMYDNSGAYLGLSTGGEPMYDASGNPVIAQKDTTHVANQENIRAILELFDRQDLILTLNPGEDISIGNFETFLSGIILDIAVTLKQSKDMTSTQSIQLLNVDTQRTSISGVSLDEEMTNLLKYQHAYSGSSRIITAMDEALDTLINRMGRVGL